MSTKKLYFNTMQSTSAIVGIICPMVNININGLNGQAIFGTGARTSVAGYQLFQKLKE